MSEITVYEFIEARIDEARRGLEGLRVPTVEHLSHIFDAIEVVLEMHRGWPILVHTEPQVDVVAGDDYLGQVKMQMTQQMDFVIHEEYVRRFGSEPPTTPMLRQIATIWYKHPDFNQDWLMTDEEWKRLFPPRR